MRRLWAWRPFRRLCDRGREAASVDPQIRRAEKAIARLPDLTREIFFLHRFDNLSYERIALRLGIEVDEVEAHIAATLAAVRRARENR